MSIRAILRFIVNHPVGRRHVGSALWRFVAWQMKSRIRSGPLTVDWIRPAKLSVRRGMTGATGNIYVGLHEFEEMGFLLHLLRQDDLFVDVGANVGSYTVLASRVVGAKSIAIEPVRATYAALCENVRLNEIDDRVDARNVGVAGSEGELMFSADMDTVNHVLTTDEESRASSVACVPVVPLSAVVGDRRPLLIKIDVEGFESEVIKGGGDLWVADSLAAVMMELNGSGRRYGFDDAEIDRTMTDLGFQRFTYDPFRRTLIQVDLSRAMKGNVIYVRDYERVALRLKSARTFSVLNSSF